MDLLINMIYFSADSHFGHSNIIMYDTTRYNFKDISHHDTTLIDNWNRVVTPQDTVYHLGDFALVNDPARYKNRLNGNIHLILGNHDHRNLSKLKLAGFASIQDVLYLKEHDIFLSHYPHYSWNKSHHGSLHLFGHVHEMYKHVPNLDRKINRNLNVGVMWHNFTPISLEEVLKY